ncbi:hypothetical protein MXE38_01465 [Anaerobiospirillum sp. NML120448]|uniref:hypothetical protein n=1 Tax=Anaerobiospirillum sp. NML120448 TaxID=2932816 RepID=UPI001FF680C0|nr:hypothetical protein [Anaerobiospirillum sp. NML120448]MCK0513547.1 hypothetical protein [Anaerobiospirillum sp. NML120448]
MNSLVVKTLAATSVALFLNGCGMVSQGITSDDSYLDKAESAIGIDKSQLTLDKDSVKGGIDAVNFDVYDKKGNRYKCYFTSAVAITSDALCTKISKDGTATPANKGNCNALLKAAGRC